MNLSIDFSLLPGYSKLFIDFINKVPFFCNSRFPSNNILLNSKEKLFEKSSNFLNRDELVKVIKSSMLDLNFTSTQKINLDNLGNNNSLAVVTGQQVGFLGGPLYTFYKIFGAINLAAQLSEQFKKELNFIPIFWVEDNDHDNLEASQSFLYDKNYSINKLFCSDSVKKEDRTCVSERVFEEDINFKIDSLSEILNNFQFKDEIIIKLKSIYQPGKKWNTAFTELINSWFAEYGLLIIHSSKAREEGLFAPLVQKEISQIGYTDSLINSANKILEKNGYHIQAKSSEINLFFHKNGKRYKIKKAITNDDSYEVNDKFYSKEELKNLAKTNPTLFSPNVLLRNVLQDYVLPSVAYIAGPSEIGYSAQILELYNYFGVEMPEILSRHSFTIVDNHFSNWLKKNSLLPEYFFRNYTNIEKELTTQITDKEITNIFENAKARITMEFTSLQDKISEIDKTLEASALAAKHKSIEQLDHLEKKVISAQKKKNTQLFEHYHQASNFFFQNETMQERYFTPINFIALFGEEKFKTMISDAVSKEADKHYYLMQNF
ncbi:MAG: bacillithiol biosynthesis cysteine-adding enzyme BshC [FCB group bacterium]|jgi:bacillithiol biosynthesis cysteine-adding enzyme BshC